jgi:hypothetical protein
MSTQRDSRRGGTRSRTRSDRFRRQPMTGPYDPADRAERPVGTPARRPPGGDDWRSVLTVASGLNILAGIWLIIAPFVLSYDNGDPYWNDIVFGAIVGVLALARTLGAYGAAWMSRLNALIGAWIVASAFWLDATSTARINNVIVGAFIFALGAVSATASDDPAAVKGGDVPR